MAANLASGPAVTVRWPARPEPGRLILAAIVLASMLALFFIAFSLTERSLRPEGLTPRPYVEFQQVDDAGKIIADAPVRRAPYAPAPIYRTEQDGTGPHVAFRIPFAIEQPRPGLALFMFAITGVETITLNGTVLQPNVPLSKGRGAVTGSSVFYPMPPEALRAGENVIEVVVNSESPILFLHLFHVGPAIDAARAVEAGIVVNNYVPIMAISILIFASLLCAVTNWPQIDRQRVTTLIVLMLLWAVRTYFANFPLPTVIPFLITLFLLFGLEACVTLACAVHLLAGERQFRKALPWLIGPVATILLYLLGTVVAGFQLGPVVMGWVEMGAVAVWCLGALLAIIGLPLLSWAMVTRQDGRRLERLTLMVCLMAFGTDAADNISPIHVPFQPDLAITIYAFPAAGLFLGLGVVASIAREMSAARRTVTEANAILAARLEEQDAELERSYEAQKLMLARQVTLEERQRIVRDMHDGIGGQLLGLMMQVRRGWADPAAVEQGLQSSLADLRLIVDSMDTAEAGIAESLRAFEHRARPMVEAAGMVLSFTSTLAEDRTALGPRPTLQVLRVMQEAVTNAIRHSGASTISITACDEPDGTSLIRIADDGKGLPDATGGGRGMANMRHRMAGIGGGFAVTSTDEGTTISLTIAPEPAFIGTNLAV